MAKELAVDDKGAIKEKAEGGPRTPKDHATKLAGIVRQEKKVTLAEKYWEQSKAETREAHGAYDAEVKRLRDMIGQAPQGTLFDTDAAPEDVLEAATRPLPDDKPAANGAAKKGRKKK